MQAQDTQVGLCKCGCGEPTPVARKTCTRNGHVKGQPVFWMPGHHRRKPGPDYIVDVATGCWLWQKTIAVDGYAVVNIPGAKRVQVRAHRLYYERYVGTIPVGLVIDHVRARGCIHRHCVNPAHLEPVTIGENVLRGDSLPALNAAKTHCKRGHPFDETNTRIDSNGFRVCCVCDRDRTRRSRARRREKRAQRAKDWPNERVES